MSKIENNRIYYDPYNEIRCDKFALEKFVKESEEKDKTIADLEAKLAEKEHTINTLIEDHKASQEWYKKQLEEKEERINWLVEAEFNRKWAKKYVEMRRKEDPMLCLPDSDEVYERYFELKQQLAEKEKENEVMAKTLKMTKFVEKEVNQDKISFAVEQLEKVRKQFDCEDNYCYGDNNIVICINKKIFNDFIDNQIKQLKEMK